MKAIRWLLKLMLVMITLPLILAVWLAKWFVAFLHHCSAWIFYLLGSVLLATAVLSFLMQQSQGVEALQMLIGGFVIFMVPQVVGRNTVLICLWANAGSRRRSFMEYGAFFNTEQSFAVSITLPPPTATIMSHCRSSMVWTTSSTSR